MHSWWSILTAVGGHSYKAFGHTQLLHEMLSRVYKGTATPRDQGPGAVYRGVFLPLVVFGFFINRTLY